LPENEYSGRTNIQHGLASGKSCLLSRLHTSLSLLPYLLFCLEKVSPIKKRTAELSFVLQKHPFEQNKHNAVRFLINFSEINFARGITRGKMNYNDKERKCSLFLF
jgi:hypothetical protein